MLTNCVVNGCASTSYNNSEELRFDQFPKDEEREKQPRTSTQERSKRSRTGENACSIKSFCRLKTTLPWVPADTKLSKLDTLRLATSYIAHLRALLHEPRSAHTPPHPLSLAWPFAFQHGGSLSCSISQRWNITPQNNDATCRNNPPPRENPQNVEYPQEYSETDYDERSYDERGYDDMTTNECAQMQYCNYGYKENYYEMRNGYSTENLLNNVG